MTTRLFKRATRGIILGSAPLWLTLTGGNAQANPQGMTVVSGSAHPVQQGNTLQITTSQNAVLQWSSFDIAAGETTLFQQPSATSIVFNNIRNANPSTIFGSLRANGIVVLQNANGFYFGPNAFVQAGGLVVTTAAINPWASGGGVGWSFDGPPATSPIVNYGTLQTASGGSLFLIGKEIENNGKISAPGGTAALVATVVGATWRTGSDAVEAQPATRSPVVRVSARAVFLAPRSAGATTPPTRTDPRTAGRG